MIKTGRSPHEGIQRDDRKSQKQISQRCHVNLSFIRTDLAIEGPRRAAEEVFASKLTFRNRITSITRGQILKIKATVKLSRARVGHDYPDFP